MTYVPRIPVIGSRVPLKRSEFHTTEFYGGRTEPCVVCGRPIKTPRWYVHVVDGGASVCDPNIENWPDGAGDLGWLPVGPECLRRHPELRPYTVEILP